jgi:putative phosphoserine phosphatase / 1-acylglycerol-3-phosphate O-acyltransferase
MSSPKLAGLRLRGPDPPSGPFPFLPVCFIAMPHSAAIFDLDRTLLAGASGSVFATAMRSAGLIGPAIPGEGVISDLFASFGESLPLLALTRQMAAKAKGRSQAETERAARAAVPGLVALVQPFVAGVLADHRAAGRLLVLATTTPHDLVTPLAAQLGFDHVIATRYGVAADGTYDGSIDGHFVWSTGKKAAVAEWAGEVGVDLKQSWFYSDSVYDAPLMMAVGHPVVVNPDPRMAVLAVARRWPTLHFDVPPGVPKLPIVGIEPQRLALAMCRPELMPFVRFDIAGVGQIPAEGPVIIIGNHRSYFDVATLAMTVAPSGRTVRFLGKKEVFDAPIVGPIARAMGGIRVERGTGSDAPLRAAAEALDAGEVVAIMPQGTIPRGLAFFDQTLTFRPGADESTGYSRGLVGDRTGLATKQQNSPRLERGESADGASPRWSAHCAEVSQRRCRLQANGVGRHGAAS